MVASGSIGGALRLFGCCRFQFDVGVLRNLMSLLNFINSFEEHPFCIFVGL